MKKKIFNILKFLGFLSLGVLLLYFTLKDINFEDTLEDLKTANYWWVALSLLFAIAAYVARAYRWNILIEPLDYKPKLTNTFYSLMVGYLANFAVPRIGEITRCASLAKKENIPFDKLVGTVIIERSVDLLSLFILLVFLMIFRLEKFGSFLEVEVFDRISKTISDTFTFSWLIWIIIGGSFAAIIALYFVYREQLAQIALVSKVKNLVKGVLSGLKTVYKMKRRLEFIIFSIIIWLLYLLMTWVVVFTMPATSDLKLIDGLFILIIGGLGMSAPVQGGFGAFHWIVSTGIASVYTNIPFQKGVVYAIISHESQAILAILLGSVSFYLLVSRKKAQKEKILQAES